MLAAWRMIDTGARDPFSNMAFDEAILRGYQMGISGPTLRLYGWHPHAISIGYAQDPAKLLDTELCRKDSIRFVRRITGGGMIMHQDELTYSLVCSKEDLKIPARVISSYKIISSFLVSFYKNLGIDAAFACDKVSGEALGRPADLCFSSKEKYDITVSGRKIGGSAQKRVKDIIFQHGSIPLGGDMKKASSFLRSKSVSRFKNNATSLEELLGREVERGDAAALLAESFEKSFSIKLSPGRLADKEEQIFEKLKRSKYETDNWNLHRLAPCLDK